MRRSRGALLSALVILPSVGCGGSDGATGPDDTVRVPATALLDLSSTLPENVGGVDLGSDAPGGLSFCEAFAATKLDWVGGAVVPLQFWIDAYADVDDEPAGATDALARVRDFADRSLAWNFKRLDVQPITDEMLLRDQLVVADAAAESCPNLPLVVGLNQTGEPPAWWADEPDASIDAMCAEDRAELAAAAERYRARVGEPPLHQEQVLTESFLSWAFLDDGDLAIGTDYFGLETNGGDTQVVPVPGGACDAGPSG